MKGNNTMDAQVQAVFDECSAGSNAGTMSFPTVVTKLTDIGAEAYHVDFRRAERTFYMPDGDSYITAGHEFGPAASEFSAEGVQDALRTIQRGEIDYAEFCRRIIDAGCVGYVVSVAGRSTVYMGRANEVYTEHFPARP